MPHHAEIDHLVIEIEHGRMNGQTCSVENTAGMQGSWASFPERRNSPIRGKPLKFALSRVNPRPAHREIYFLCGVKPPHTPPVH